MLSNDTLWPILAKNFAAVRLDWEQGNHYREKFGFVLGTGDQLLLKPDGALVPPQEGKKVYGRHGENITPEVLTRIREMSKGGEGIQTLKLDWFFWTQRPSGKRRGGSYPVPLTAIAQFARLPIAEVNGPLPEALADTGFLRRHVRQFLWKRGREDGDASIRLHRVRDGLPAALPTELATLDGERLAAGPLGEALDAAWRTYMKDRPLTARGYVENEHGGWMRKVAPQMLHEDKDMRAQARAGTLKPPGRE